MSLLALLLAAHAVPAQTSATLVEQAALLEAFRSMCRTSPGNAGELAAPVEAFGFRRTRVMPTDFEWIETASWERDGVRLFQMTDPREQDPRPMCGVRAQITGTDTDDGIVEAVAKMTNAAFGEGHSANHISNTTLALRGGAVSIDIDRSGAPDVRVRLIAWSISS